MAINNFPIIGSIYQWWINYSPRQDLEQLREQFKTPATIQKPQIQRTVQLLETCKANAALKKEAGALERAYFTYLKKSGRSVPKAYQCKENCDLAQTFAKLGIGHTFFAQSSRIPLDCA